ncbi:hypothetical protein GCM10008905_31680 [Clostridium malenominatum]|uniref:Uncharacterized protein n=1 Tax=Clostridium malenominatum TaxID=1539 RepID=A0ABN1J6U2_9CLOT
MDINNKNIKLKYYEYSSETAKKYKVKDWFVLSIGLMFFTGALYLEVIISDFLIYYNKFPDEVRLKITIVNIWIIISVFLICCMLTLIKGRISLNKRYIVYAIDNSNTMYQYNFRRGSDISVIPGKLDNLLYGVLISYLKLKETTEKVDISKDSLRSVIKFHEIISCIVKKKYIILTANVSKINRRGVVKQYKYKKKIYKQYNNIEDLIESILLEIKKGGA